MAACASASAEGERPIPLDARPPVHLGILAVEVFVLLAVVLVALEHHLRLIKRSEVLAIVSGRDDHPASSDGIVLLKLDDEPFAVALFDCLD